MPARNEGNEGNRRQQPPSRVFPDSGGWPIVPRANRRQPAIELRTPPPMKMCGPEPDGRAKAQLRTLPDFGHRPAQAKAMDKGGNTVPPGQAVHWQWPVVPVPALPVGRFCCR